MKLTRYVLPMLGTLMLAAPAMAGSMVCSDAGTKETCETSQFVFEITRNQSVVVTEKAVPGATGDVRELPFVVQKRNESPFAEQAYDAGSYHVEVGHTDGTQIYLRIGSQTWNFFYEVGTP